MHKVLGATAHFTITSFCNIPLCTLKIAVTIAISLLGPIAICNLGIKEFVKLLHIINDEGGWC